MQIDLLLNSITEPYLFIRSHSRTTHVAKIIFTEMLRQSIRSIASICFAVVLAVQLVVVAILTATLGLAILIAAPFTLLCKQRPKPFNYLLSSFYEFFGFVIATMAYPIDLTFFDPDSQTAKKETQKGKTPILLVHGYLHNSSGWAYLRCRLQKLNCGPIYTINLGSPFKSIDDYAKRVQKKVARIFAETGANQITLVGHSMGGVVSSHYAISLAAPGSVKKVITLGSPLQGTILAPIGFGQCAKELRRDSPFLKEFMHSLEDNMDIPFVHFRSESDLIIQPNDSAAIVNSCSRTYKDDIRGHVSYLFSSSIASRLSYELTVP